MIQLKILVEKQATAHKIAEALVQNKYCTSVHISGELTSISSQKNTLKKTTRHQIIATTKALLFQQINTFLKETFGEDKILEIYSLAIVYMDETKANYLVENTKKV